VPKLALILGTLLVLVGVFLYLSDNPTFIKATRHQPEAFTELYFADPAKLPAAIQAGQEVPLNFVLHNSEGKPMIYKYRITFAGPDGDEQTLAEDWVGVEAGHTRTINQDVLIPRGEGRGDVSVKLINKGQAIHFWVERSL
jgi:hypothetical protein